MVRTEPTYHIVIDATFANKVHAIQGLVDLYRRTMPERMEAIQRAITHERRRALEEATTAVANSLGG